MSEGGPAGEDYRTPSGASYVWSVALLVVVLIGWAMALVAVIG